MMMLSDPTQMDAYHHNRSIPNSFSAFSGVLKAWDVRSFGFSSEAAFVSLGLPEQRRPKEDGHQP